MKSISLFNHKGGVSKTTTAFNLGWSLSNLDQKVLLLDLDPQCNLTGISTNLDFEKLYNDRRFLTLEPIVKKIISGGSSDDISRDGELLQINENLMLLAGSLEVAELDNQIGTALKVNQSLPILTNLIENLFKSVDIIAKKNKIDYVIYDLSPSIGGLNEIVLMNSDFFIVPTSPDYFCLQAIGSLSKKVLQWHKEIEANSNLSFIKNKPLFLGLVQQRFRIRNSEPTKAFGVWIDKIRKETNDVLVRKLLSIGCVVSLELFEKAKKFEENAPYDLVQIPEFNTLVAISQKCKKPVFELTAEDVENAKQFGNALETSCEKIEDLKEIFKKFGEEILELTR